ncbi:AlpA family transcriptional regulator [Pectobacterium odoriferum]|uniref:helix-turn-helix transcriptional regulator n=1 Tax=Pectobacterium odoriferum TaxID=78398 RepID=UPI0013738609|nr:AlpA family transcriptional regulator [Pectobacterium odoriferum]QHP79159.1 AlpA family transcriptional regulator [Pectobacterium odoriferum]
MLSATPPTPIPAMPPMSPHPVRERLMRLPEVLHVTGISRSTLYELSARNAFPARVPLGGKNVAWVESEIHHWVAERIAARQQENHA